jgi:hypothetical protein
VVKDGRSHIVVLRASPRKRLIAKKKFIQQFRR